VDTSVWEKFHRWQIINTVLEAGLLTIAEGENGTFKLQETRSRAEKSSPAEEKSSVDMQTEVKPSTSGAELQTSGDSTDTINEIVNVFLG